MALSDLTVDQVAEELQVHDQTILRLIHSGKLPAHDVGAGERSRYRITRKDLDQFKSRRKVDPQPQRSTRRRPYPRGRSYV